MNCSIKGCTRPVEVKWVMMCGQHYRLERNAGRIGVSRKTPKSTEERFWEKVDKNGPLPELRPELGPCWLWTASVISQGYGQFISGVGTQTAHRYSFLLAHGYLPPRRDAVDHLCLRPLCVNPDHLEHTSRRTNTMRGNSPPAINARKTHCDNGHEYTEENTDRTDGHRRCRRCRRDQGNASHRKRYAAMMAQRSLKSG